MDGWQLLQQSFRRSPGSSRQVWLQEWRRQLQVHSFEGVPDRALRSRSTRPCCPRSARQRLQQATWQVRAETQSISLPCAALWTLHAPVGLSQDLVP